MSEPVAARPLGAFAGYGLEIEYMIVDRASLDVRPIADRLLQIAAGHATTEVERGEIGWSNELALHVIELKNLRPLPVLDWLPDAFAAEIATIDALLAPLGAQLMPGAMHPWMDPRRETHLWPHANAEIYRAFDRLFDCRRHGWSNVQSMHLNLPFGDADEFARLHAAIRLALPILPALAASSPWAERRPSGYQDFRLALYRDHQRALPASMGECIPDPALSPAQYRADIIEPMYRQLAAHADGLDEDAAALRHEWLDVRGAAPRFARNAIEIRVLDVQECPSADCAVAAATAALVRRIYEAPELPALPTADLLVPFAACIRDGERALLDDPAYLARLGLHERRGRAGELWQRLIEELARDGLLAPRWLPALRHILWHGTLARRIERAVDGQPIRLPAVYRTLCECLRQNRPYTPGMEREE